MSASHLAVASCFVVGSRIINGFPRFPPMHVETSSPENYSGLRVDFRDLRAVLGLWRKDGCKKKGVGTTGLAENMGKDGIAG